MCRQFVVLILIMLFQPFAVARESIVFPSCLAEVCLDQNLLNERQLIARFGGHSTVAGYKTRGYCYRSESGATPIFAMFLLKKQASEWKVVTVRVADKPICKSPTLLSDARLSASGGVGIGTRMADVVAAYGSPKYTHDSKSSVVADLVGKQEAARSDGALQYVPEDVSRLLSAIFIIRNESVAAIEISADE